MRNYLLIFVLVFACAKSTRGKQIPPLITNEITTVHAFTVVDSLTNEMLPNANVQIIYRNDTIRGVTTRIPGLFNHYAFEYNKRFKDNICVTTSYMGYQTQTRTISRDKIERNIVISLTEDVKQIKKIIIEGHQVAMIMRGDTTIYNAAAFKTMEGDFLSALFEKLPGVRMESNGVYVNGEKIDRIYVDGQRFFGNDTQAPLENMRAGDVKNVKVYEEDNADDIRLQKRDKRKDKVMDITTKSRPKLIRNIMLTLEGGAGTEKDTHGKLPIRHMERAIANVFSPTQSVMIGFLNSQNRMENSVNFLNPISTSSGGEGALNYSYHKADSTIILANTNITYGKTDEELSSRRIYYPSDIYTNREYLSYTDLTDKKFNINQNNELHLARRKHIIDFKLNLGYEGIQNNGLTGSQTITDGQQLVTTRQHSVNKMRGFNLEGTYKHKYSISKGRYIQWGAEGGYRRNRDDGWQIDTSATDGFRTHLDNYKNGHNLSYGLSGLYNEPVGQHASLVFSYGLQHIDRHSQRISTDYLLNPLGALDSLNSHNYTVKSNRHTLSAGYSYADKKLSFNVGAHGIANRIARNESFPEEYNLPYTFYHFAPAAKLAYKLTKSNTISFIYNTTPQEIALEDMRKELNTQNPLYITAGNPDLKPTALRDIDVSYRTFNATTSSNIVFSIGASFATNYTAYYTQYFDKKTYLPEYDYTVNSGTTLSSVKNAEGKYSLTGNIEYSRHLEKLKSTLRATLNYEYSNIPIFQGDIQNDMKRHQIDLTVGYMSGFSSTINLNLESTTSGGYADMTNRSTKYLQEILRGQIKVQIQKYTLVGICLYQYYHNPDLDDVDQNKVYFNCEIGRKLGQRNNMEIALGVADLFNQSRSRNTIIQNDYIQTTTKLVLGRCAYLSLNYSF